MLADHTQKCSEEKNLWANSIFETSGSGSGSKEGSDMMKQSNNNSSSNSPLPEMVPPPEAEQVGNKRNRKGKSTAAATGGAAGGGEGGESEHEMHILTERERRKKMRSMFSNLHSLLPQLPAKADKSTIVDEAVRYIQTLEQTVQTLEKQKLERFRSATTIIDYRDHSKISSAVQSHDSREAFLADRGPSPKNLSIIPSSNNVMNFISPSSFQVPMIPPIAAEVGFQTWFSPNVVVNMCGDEAQISVCSPKKPGLLATICYILEKHNLEVVSAHISSNGYRSMYMIHAHAGGGTSSDQFPAALTVEETFKLAVGEMNLWLLTC